MKYYFIPILLTLFIYSCVSDSENSPNKIINHINVGSSIPDFTVSDGNGNVFNSKEFAGKRSLLVFFHTDCNDCKRELPLIEQVYRELLPESGCLVVTIAREQPFAEVDKYWNDNGFTMPKYIDSNRTVYSLFANSVIPRLYVINTKGEVTWMAIEQSNVSVEQLVNLIKNQ